MQATGSLERSLPGGLSASDDHRQAVFAFSENHAPVFTDEQTGSKAVLCVKSNAFDDGSTDRSAVKSNTTRAFGENVYSRRARRG